jgi:ethanolamine utilization protein EutQ (cupin superfamily)
VIHVVRKNERNLEPVEIPGVSVRACDPIMGKDGCLSAGFSEYDAPCSFSWTFEYNEVFFMIEGELSLAIDGGEPIMFQPGDLGYIEAGAATTITVPQHAYFLHVTQPAWRE